MNDRKARLNPSPNPDKRSLRGLYPELEFSPLKNKIRTTEIFAEIAERHKNGTGKPGDWTKAAKLMLSLSKREIIGLVLDLSNRGDFSFYHHILELKLRTPGEFDRAREKAVKKHYRNTIHELNNQKTVAQVKLIQSGTPATIDEAFETLAEGEPYSAAKVKGDYMAGIKEARKRGYASLQPPNHMIDPIRVPLDQISPKGRRPKKG